MTKQVYNPFLPLNEYVPDGEPHVFGDRVYLFGSHDKEGGDTYCMLDYVVFSADITNLADWRCEGTIYSARQDPEYSEKYKYMYAPDVVQGNDGRYYLYYCMSGGCFTSPIHVAVCDTPAGKYEYYGCVRNSDGTPYSRCITFDPGLINDTGIIRLYYGFSLSTDKEILNVEQDEEGARMMQEQLLQAQMSLFAKTKEEILAEPQGIMGAFVVTLDDDMLTVISEPKRIVPGQLDASGTSFEGHAFFEASSIRKIDKTYYFIYSSQVSHELCYATSKFPDRDFVYGGTIISNGDIGYQGRQAKDRINATGNNHGSIECINGQYYIFYHRPTHKNNFSRQACAERVTITKEGLIPQVEVTTSGLNSGPLKAQGKYPSVIACQLTNGNMPHLGHEPCKEQIPFITHEVEQQFVTDIYDGVKVGYKYFQFNEVSEISVEVRGNAEGIIEVSTDLDNKIIATINILPTTTWHSFTGKMEDFNGISELYFTYRGNGFIDFKSFTLTK
ncbi:MAG: family 43 glycosylhydrolase [Neobacillus sp.]